MESDRDLLEFWRKHKWTIILACLGLIFAISVVTYGFFKALFIFICIAFGIWGGMKLDQKLSKKKDAEDFFYHD